MAGIALLMVCACARPVEPASAPTVVEVPAGLSAAQPGQATQRWPADAPLRAGMARIRVATDALEHAEHGHLDSGQVLALADELQSAVNGIFAECKLEPAADAALHPLLARVLAASQSLRRAPSELQPAGDLRAVLERYPQLFDDPEWLRSGE